MSKLNPNAQKWVDALRSGKYKQGRYQLNDGTGLCCLGVGCEVAKDNGIGVRKESYYRGFSYDTHRVSMPAAVCNWLHLFRDKLAVLMRLNDDDLLSFPQIAAFIEEHAKELGVAA